MWLKADSATSPQKQERSSTKTLSVDAKNRCSHNAGSRASNQGEQIFAVAPMPAGIPLCVDTLAPFSHSGKSAGTGVQTTSSQLGLANVSTCAGSYTCAIGAAFAIMADAASP
ncbi:hypothetical protein QBC34DRAFT_426575 [Podospora aff. communis PSN243]|uniref:Uncharacterized protein n=1 Tax=Podospora aff. communis PSN243 TaxID=3040156 RepID=A0AAV9GJ15_9PEZI|nr:hypothetical protein QBC34DRAFT_426575 [Podospora aff. communis PSN243]